MEIEFKDFGKIPRFRTVRAVVTEKIDGTNAQIYVPDDPSAPVLAGSRNRWVTPERDNYGFAAFVYQHAEAFRRLGPGRHFGEWWGAGIQRRYGLAEKRLSLFNHGRFSGGLPEGLPSAVSLVPVLYDGAMDSAAIGRAIDKLYRDGSVACPGWATPEGVIIECAGQRWKVTDNGDKVKGREEHIRAIMDTLDVLDTRTSVQVEGVADDGQVIRLSVSDSALLTSAKRAVATTILERREATHKVTS